MSNVFYYFIFPYLYQIRLKSGNGYKKYIIFYKKKTGEYSFTIVGKKPVIHVVK